MAGETSPTGKPEEALKEFWTALEANGWEFELREPVSRRGAANPTLIHLRRGSDRRRFLTYAWFLADEGNGRAKDGYRIQATRSHPGLLTVEKGLATVGLGWEPRRRVFAAFDGWTRRYTKRSTAFHVKDALLKRALAEGWAEDDQPWERRAAFTAPNVERLLTWVAAGQAGRREAPMKALEILRVDADHAEIVGDVWAQSPATWLREGDRLIATDGKQKLVDDSLWRVEELESFTVDTEGGRYTRTHIRFRCRRVGTVHAEDVVEMLS